MDFKELERSISDKQTADIVKLLLLKTYQPDSLTVQEKEDHKHLWKDAVERHFRKTGVAASEDTLDSIWATVRSDLLSAKEPQVHDTFKFQLRAMSQKELDDDEKELPNLALHRCITNVSGIRSVLISREWIDLPSNEERARQKNKKYVEVSSDTPAINRRIACPELASSVSEVQTNIVFFDMEKTTVDWPSTIRNLQEYAQSHYYDHLMVKIALINILKYSSRFSDIEYFLDKDADQIARHLLRSSANDDKFTYHRTKLFNLTRRVNQPLTEILEVADQYISVLFKGEGNKKQRENYSLLALLSFVSDDLSTHISDQIKLKKSMGENINLQYYRNLCLKMEAQKGNMPPVPLKFNRKVDFLPAVSMTMNCHQDEDSPYKRMLRYNDGLRNFNHQSQGDGMYCFVPAGMSYEVYYRHNNAHYKIPISDIAVDDVKSAILSEKAPVNQILPSIIQNFPTAVSKQDFDIKFMDANNTLNPQDRQRYVQSTNPVGTVQMIQTPPAAGINNQNLYPSLPGIMQPSCPPMPQAILPYYHSDKDPKSPEYYTDTSSVKSFEYKQADAFNVPVKGQRSGGLPRTPVKHVDNRSVKSPARIIQGLKDAMKQTVSEPVRTRSNEDLTNQSMRNIVDVIDSQQGKKNVQHHYTENNDYTNKSRSLYRNDSSRDRNEENRATYRRNQGSNNSPGRDSYNNSRRPRSDIPENKSLNDFSKNKTERDNRSYTPVRTRSSKDYEQRNRSKDYEQRNRSKDYEQRNRSRDYERRNRSRDYEQRNRSRDYERKNRSNDYERRNRSNDYKQTNRSNNYGQYRQRSTSFRENRDNNKYPDNRRTPSRDRQSFQKTNYQRNDRSMSGGRNVSQYRARSNSRNFRQTSNRSDRDQYRSRRDRFDTRDNRRSSTPQSNRPASVDKYKWYKNYQPGKNCAHNYDPTKDKYCSKCRDPSHHEFHCQYYERYNPEMCSACRDGKHFPNECRNRKAGRNVQMNSLITAHSDELSKQYLPPDVIDEISNKIAVSLGIKN